MGGTESKKVSRPTFNRINYEIVCSKVFHHAQLQRDRRIAELQKSEAKLKELMMQDNLNHMAVIAQANDSLEHLKYVKGANIVLRYVNILKEQSLNIEQMYKQHVKDLGELETYVHTVVWSTKRLNLTIIQEFNGLIATYFDNKIWQIVEVSTKVDLELKKNFASLIASPQEQQEYLEKFCDRNNIDKIKLIELWPPAPVPVPGPMPVPDPNTGFNNNPMFQTGITNNTNQTNNMGYPIYDNQISNPCGNLGQRVAELKRIGA